jgi:hypothetical protein
VSPASPPPAAPAPAPAPAAPAPAPAPAPDASIARQLSDLYAGVRDEAASRGFTAASVPEILVLTMVASERVRGAEGAEKKAAALALTRRLLIELPLTDGDRVGALAVLDLVGPAVIDLLVAAARGEISLGPPAAKPCCAVA